ncbi:hypothetical protein D5R40_00340 [Okeania hirsuta]|uniref:Tc1-like transposase DDE domain-containing protein n=1 Tax=Okeania hirsuta TaxID=1458930 RepID=A0A3N6RSK3_9CYAN|nr:hypothetical protein D4Z78_03835 [Okeania hirsuta]RQH57613.1 hypothetical protein D5R40_00340 [Okeania hirsuta]
MQRYDRGFYEVFELAQARRIAKKLEIQHTPKYGSWLKMLESELYQIRLIRYKNILYLHHYQIFINFFPPDSVLPLLGGGGVG